MSEYNKHISHSTGLIDQYEKWLVSDHLDYQYRDYSYYHPSDLGYCIRKAVMMKVGFEGEYYTLPRLQRIFENGHSTHARFQEHFSRMGIIYGRWKCYNCHKIMGNGVLQGFPRPSKCEFCSDPKMQKVYDNKGKLLYGPYPLFEYRELPVEHDKMKVKGHTDGILQLDKSLYVIDFKTCSQAAFNDVVATNCPMEAHIFQVNIYMYVLGVENGIILYENRNDLRMKEFRLYKDSEVMAEVLKRIILAEKCLAEGTIPPIPDKLNASAFACAGYPGCPPCPFFHRCFVAEAELAKKREGKYLDFVKTDKEITDDY